MATMLCVPPTVAKRLRTTLKIRQRAIAEDRTLITFDQHFGDWAILPPNEHPGVIRLKVHPTTTANAAKVLLPFLKAHKQDDFRNYLIILSPGALRWINTATNSHGPSP